MKNVIALKLLIAMIALINSQEDIEYQENNFNYEFIEDDNDNITGHETSNKIIEAENKLNISLSFRQINFFEISNSTITFKFFGLTTKKLEKEYEIILSLNLISEDGTFEFYYSRAKCILDESVNPIDGQAQADFSCSTIEFEQTKVYKSFIVSYSDDFVGIPDEEILLDPIVTAEAIANNTLVDYSNFV